MRQSTTTLKSRALKWGRWLLFFMVALGIAGELIGRYYGLGSPPLLVVDPKIEYYYNPSSTYHRFGNHIQYNAYAMRCEGFPETKGSEDELRIMVLGDSVVNGGAKTDQSQLATSLLKEQLQDSLKRPVVVGNISAGSWGPANLLAYVNRYGLFEADIVVIVLSSHDYADILRFAPLTVPTVDRSPTFALEELATTYLPRLVAKIVSSTPPKPPETQQDIDQVRQDMRKLIDITRGTGAQVLIVQHLEKPEVQGTTMPGHQVFKQLAEDMDVPVVQLGPVFAKALRAGNNPYRDKIHPNILGQELMAGVLYNEIKQRLESGQ